MKRLKESNPKSQSQKEKCKNKEQKYVNKYIST